MSFKNLVKKLMPDFLLSFYHYCLALIGAFLYGFPSQKLTIIGVTGTSGKSTVVELAAKILEEAGFKVASLSSIKFKIGEKEWENKLKMTMPGRLKIQKFLSQAVKADCKYAVLEVTSEGIKQFRHKFIKFDIAVLTNLSPEHIEAHGGWEKYRACKGKLFEATKKNHIINIDDKNSDYFWKIPAENKISYSLKEADSLPKDFQLFGQFNLYNALAATKIGLAQGVSLEICKSALEKIRGIPGRMEIVIREPFTVIVDYAHTPEALKNVYETLRNSKLICVLGACGGGRDKWKRPVLGKIAAQYCEEVIITNEDPYDEEPIEIIEQVARGAGGKAKKILDRREAIKKALGLTKPGDIVVVTGKGSEPWICVAKGRKTPWDDRAVVREEFEKLKKKYEILEHRADLKIRVFGESKEQLFLNALFAMTDNLKPENRNSKTEIRNIKINSPNLETLLVDFLSEVLYLIQVNKEIYTNVEFNKFSDNEIEAELSGQKVGSFGEDIKAVTYHNLDVHQEKDGKWQATILFDI